VTVRAERAAHLLEQGETLRTIATELGFRSVTSVTNLLKTIGHVDSHYGRPPRIGQS
jgi:hypothetical protein